MSSGPCPRRWYRYRRAHDDASVAPDAHCGGAVDGDRRAVVIPWSSCSKRPVRLFAYPYGGPDAFSTVTTQMVRNAGYEVGCTATGGLANGGCDPLHIPRNVVGDWDPDTFKRWLNRWLRC